MTTNQIDSERGAAMIEFAISAVVLVMLVFGVIGVAMAFYSYEVVNQYSRDASRYAMVHGAGCQEAAHGGASCSACTGIAPAPSCSTANGDLQTYLSSEPYPGINTSQVAVTAVYGVSPGEGSCNATNCNGAGDQVTVTVSYPYLYAIPFIPKRNFTMSASSTMVISQ